MGKHHSTHQVAAVLDALGIQSAKLDWSYIEHWCDELGCRTDLDQLRQIAAKE